jgi:hypothetical protein
MKKEKVKSPLLFGGAKLTRVAMGGWRKERKNRRT